MSHIELLEKHNACEDAVEWASQYPDLATAWDACHRPDWMLWLHGKGIITISARDLRLFACDCARYTPIAERYANGDATVEELDAAWAAAWNAAWYARVAAWDAAERAADAAGAEDDAAWHAAEVAASAFQADLLRKRIGNPFKGGHEL